MILHLHATSHGDDYRAAAAAALAALAAEANTAVIAVSHSLGVVRARVWVVMLFLLSFLCKQRAKFIDLFHSKYTGRDGVCKCSMWLCCCRCCYYVVISVRCVASTSSDFVVFLFFSSCFQIIIFFLLVGRRNICFSNVSIFCNFFFFRFFACKWCVYVCCGGCYLFMCDCFFFFFFFFYSNTTIRLPIGTHDHNNNIK